MEIGLRVERNHLEPSVNSAVVPSQVRWRVNLILIDEMSQISNRHPIHHRRSDSGRVLSYEMICFVASQPQTSVSLSSFSGRGSGEAPSWKLEIFGRSDLRFPWSSENRLNFWFLASHRFRNANIGNLAKSDSLRRFIVSADAWSYQLVNAKDLGRWTTPKRRWSTWFVGVFSLAFFISE